MALHQSPLIMDCRNFGLKHYGPLKTVLAVDFADVALHYLLRLIQGTREVKGGRLIDKMWYCAQLTRRCVG
jgi:hypothetical protein